MDEMADHELFAGYELLRVASQESYAANCVRVNERVLVAAGYPRFTAELNRARVPSAGTRDVRVSKDGWRIELPFAAVLKTDLC